MVWRPETQSQASCLVHCMKLASKSSRSYHLNGYWGDENGEAGVCEFAAGMVQTCMTPRLSHSSPVQASRFSFEYTIYK